MGRRDWKEEEEVTIADRVPSRQRNDKKRTHLSLRAKLTRDTGRGTLGWLLCGGHIWGLAGSERGIPPPKRAGIQMRRRDRGEGGEGGGGGSNALRAAQRLSSISSPAGETGSGHGAQDT